MPTRGHFYTVVVWCMGALRTECSHGLLMVGAMGGAGVVYSGSLKVAPGCYCGGLLYLFRLAGVACGLGTEEGGVQLSRQQESLPVLIIFYFPRQCMQCKGFDDSIAAFLTAGGISSSFLLARWEEAISISIDWEVYLFFDTFLLI